MGRQQRSGSWLSSSLATEMALGLPPVTPFVAAHDRGMALANRRRRAAQQKRWRVVRTCVPSRGGGETDANNKSYISARFLKNTRWAGYLWQWYATTPISWDVGSTSNRRWVRKQTGRNAAKGIFIQQGNQSFGIYYSKQIRKKRSVRCQPFVSKIKAVVRGVPVQKGGSGKRQKKNSIMKILIILRFIGFNYTQLNCR